MRKLLVWFIILNMFILSLGFAFGCAAPTEGIDPEDFYRGRTVTLVVPFRPGGGSDTVGRLWAKYFEVHTGANVKVENKEVGGGLEGHNYMYKAAKQDGSVIAFTERANMWPASLAQAPGTEFKMEDFKYAGHMPVTPFLMLVGTNAPYKSVEDLQRAQGLKCSGTAPGAGETIAAAVAADALGLDMQIVLGFRGGGPVWLAMSKGEIEVCVFPGPGPTQIQIEKGTAKPLFWIATETDPYFPDLPALTDIVSVSEEKEEMIDLCGSLIGGKLILAPPGIPEDRLAFLRKVSDDIAARADFQQDYIDYYGMWLYVTGEETNKAAEELSQRAYMFKEAVALAEKYAK